MKLPSHLAKSRHGVYYFRFTYRVGSSIKEIRHSLKTRNPTDAKTRALYISSVLMGAKMSSGYDPKRFNPNDPGTWPPETRSDVFPDGGAEAASIVRKLQIQVGNTTIIADQNDPADLKAAREMVEALGGGAGQVATDGITRQLLNGVQASSSANQALKSNGDMPKLGSSGYTFDELIGRYLARTRDRLSAKTKYEYQKMLEKFEQWLYAKKSLKPFFIRHISRSDISDFIDDLMAEKVTAQTIQKKYLSALNGVFSLAQTMGAIPDGQLPTQGHKLFNKKDKKKAQHASGYKPFSEEELALIFDHETLLTLEKPCDFWLPLLGLFTGGRISELCQLLVTDIRRIDGIWAIDINDEDAAQTLKTPAAVRKIPLHPMLIELGFLEYLDMARPYGGTIFPYITPDRFMHYGKTPGRRFGEFLDRLKITNSTKVFHSFRSTSNNWLKQRGVEEETRCQFVGHEHGTINSKIYGEGQREVAPFA